MVKGECVGDLTVDCANGVGAAKLQELAKHVSSKLRIHVANDGTTGRLNENCGADYVKINQKAPNGMLGVMSLPYESCELSVSLRASVD